MSRLGAFPGRCRAELTVTDYHRGDLPNSAHFVVEFMNSETSGTPAYNEVETFRRYLARGLGEVASKPKVGEARTGGNCLVLPSRPCVVVDCMCL